MDYQLNLGFFEGPLDLLFHLVKKNKLEINQISLADVTEQYLAYIRQMKDRDLDFAGDFLVMAAQLMELKSRTLLPSNEDTETDQNQPHELVTRLLEYKRFKEIASVLKEKEEEGDLYYSRSNEDLIEEVMADLPDFNPLENVTLDDFRQAFTKALVKAAQKEQEQEEKEAEGEIKAEEFNIRDKMTEIEIAIEEYPDGIGFARFFSQHSCRLEVVVTFLALLELMKLKKIRVTQDKLYGEMIICR